MHVAWSFRAVDVITVVKAATERYDRPGHIRTDNGPEFIAYAIGDWLKAKRVAKIYIQPGRTIVLNCPPAGVRSKPTKKTSPERISCRKV